MGVTLSLLGDRERELQEESRIMDKNKKPFTQITVVTREVM